MILNNQHFVPNNQRGSSSLIFILMIAQLLSFALFLLKIDYKRVQHCKHTISNNKGNIILEFIIWSLFYLSLLTVVLHSFTQLHSQLNSLAHQQQVTDYYDKQ